MKFPFVMFSKQFPAETLRLPRRRRGKPRLYMKAMSQSAATATLIFSIMQVANSLVFTLVAPGIRRSKS